MTKIIVRAAGSNLSPGPTTPRYLAGARITSVHPFAPVMRGTPLSIALMSYAGRVGFGIDADPTEIPDPARIAALIGREITMLERRTHRRGYEEPSRFTDRLRIPRSSR